MRTLLICPWAEEITEVQIPAGQDKQLLAVYHQLSNSEDDWLVDQVEALRVLPGHHLLVDEEPLIKHSPPSFQFQSFGLIYGKALLLAIDDEEEWHGTSLPISEIQELVRFHG